MVAALAMGAISRQNASAQSMAPGASPGGGLAGMLGQFLDANRDGSIADDLLGMASKILNKQT